MILALVDSATLRYLKDPPRSPEAISIEQQLEEEAHKEKKSPLSSFCFAASTLSSTISESSLIGKKFCISDLQKDMHALQDAILSTMVYTNSPGWLPDQWFFVEKDGSYYIKTQNKNLYPVVIKSICNFTHVLVSYEGENFMVSPTSQTFTPSKPFDPALIQDPEPPNPLDQNTPPISTTSDPISTRNPLSSSPTSHLFSERAAASSATTVSTLSLKTKDLTPEPPNPLDQDTPTISTTSDPISTRNPLSPPPTSHLFSERAAASSATTVSTLSLKTKDLTEACQQIQYLIKNAFVHTSPPILEEGQWCFFEKTGSYYFQKYQGEPFEITFQKIFYFVSALNAYSERSGDPSTFFPIDINYPPVLISKFVSPKDAEDISENHTALLSLYKAGGILFLLGLVTMGTQSFFSSEERLPSAPMCPINDESRLSYYNTSFLPICPAPLLQTPSPLIPLLSDPKTHLQPIPTGKENPVLSYYDQVVASLFSESIPQESPQTAPMEDEIPPNQSSFRTFIQKAQTTSVTQTLRVYNAVRHALTFL